MLFKSLNSLFIFTLFFQLLGCNGLPEEKINKELEGNSELSSLEITPSLQSLYVNQTQQFIGSGGVPPYTFSLLSGVGTIDSLGLYTAPGSKGQAKVRVTDLKGTTRDALVNVEVQIAISPTSLKMNVNTSFQFQTSGGSPPYIYSVTSGSSTIDSSGTITASGSPQSLTVKVTDAEGFYAEAAVEVGNGPIISPATAYSPIGQTYQFSQTSGTPPYVWSVITGTGSINSSGLFMASETDGTSIIKVTDANGFHSTASITTFKQNKLALGSFHTCVLLGDTQKIKCVGNRTNGATGDQKLIIGDELSDMGDALPSPKIISIASSVPTITSSTYYNQCGIFEDGLTRCWGYSGHGQNGGTTYQTGHIAGTTEASFSPVPADLSNPIVDLARKGNSGYHQCGIYLNGDLKCWGYNPYGNLGQNNVLNYGGNFTTLSLYSAAPIALGQATYKVETGEYHTCAILADKNVKCWGYNAQGQLGLGHVNAIGNEANEMQSLLPLDFSSDVEDIALGAYHSCALMANGRVTCWGYNAQGQLGREDVLSYGDEIGENPINLTAIDLGTDPLTSLPRKAVKIDAGHYHTCALLDNGTMKCWGYNNIGQLGQEDTILRGDNAGEMGNALPTVYLGAGTVVKDIFAGGNHSCAVLSTEEVKCWGANDSGQLGLGYIKTKHIGDNANEMGPNLLSVNLGTGITAVHQMTPVAGGTCANVTQNGQRTMKCWGLNVQGVLGNEDLALGDEASDLGKNLTPISLGTTKAVSAISAGSEYNCATFNDGTAKCWGYNGSYVLGTNGAGGLVVGESANSMDVNLSYLISGSGITIAKTFLSQYSNEATCGLFNSDTLSNALKCWGNNGYGGLGRVGSAYYIPGITPIDLGAGRYATDVAISHYRTCAVLDNGTVKCWGLNNYGQLGRGNIVNFGGNAGDMTTLQPIDLGTSVVANQICSGIYHSCIKTNTGKVKCWGYNAHGQLGHGTNIDRGNDPGEMGDALPYVELGTGRTATKVTCGNYGTCALLDNKKIKCWGNNNSGQAGVGTTINLGVSATQMGNNLSYVNLGTGRLAIDLASGGDHNCAVLENNEIKCWGLNNWGQLGIGNILTIGDQLGEMGDALKLLDIE